PANNVRSRAGLLPSIRNRPPLCTSNSPPTVRLDGCVKFTNPFVLTKNLPPAGTFTGTRTVASDPPRNNGSANTSHNPRFSTRPLPPKSNTLFRLIHRNVPRLVNTPLRLIVVLVTTSQRAPAPISTLVPKLTVPPFNCSVAPPSTVSNPVNPLLLRSDAHTSELQSRTDLVFRLLHAMIKI